MARKFKRYNNGEKNIIVYEGDPIPEGFIPGTVPWSEEKKKEIVAKRNKTSLERYGVDSPSKSQEIKEKKRKIFQEKYGADSPFQSKECRDKAKQTNLERYGVENPSQSQEIKEKKKHTCLQHFGVEHPMQSKEVQEKSRESVLEIYGVEHISQSDYYKDRFKQSCLEHYGTENPFQSEEIKNKIKQTNLERYGVENPSQSEEIKVKRRETNEQLYGTREYFSSEDFRDKSIKTNLSRYGVENPFQSEEIKEKIRKTNLENIDVEYPMQSKEVQEKSKQTSLERYGTDYPNQSEEVKAKIVKSSLERYGFAHPAQSEEVKAKTRQTNLERYGVEWTCITNEVRSHINNDSKPNREFSELLSSNGIEHSREFSLKSYSYDFKVGDVLIEINPSPTHNSLWTPFDQDKGLSSDYHLKKMINAENYGYRCIHVFDWNSQEKIVKVLLSKKDVIYARNTTLKELSRGQTDLFLNTYHLQSTRRNQEIRLGLYYNQELISIMTFGKPRYNKNYEYELLRYCSSKNVIGGAQKLFTHFIRQHNPKSIISYCDRSKFRGDVYKKLGFTLIRSSDPARHWYNIKTEQHITDNLLLQMGFDKIFGASYGKGTSNVKLMIEHGFLPIYDCGQGVYIWKAK